MSYELNFWRYKPGTARDNEAVYEQACRLQRELDCLEDLPVAEIEKAIGDAFSDWELYPGPAYVKDPARVSFAVITTSQTVCLRCWGMDAKDINRLIGVMRAFNCPYYDSYLQRRFDKWTDG